MTHNDDAGLTIFSVVLNVTVFLLLFFYFNRHDAIACYDCSDRQSWSSLVLHIDGGASRLIPAFGGLAILVAVLGSAVYVVVPVNFSCSGGEHGRPGPYDPHPPLPPPPPPPTPPSPIPGPGPIRVPTPDPPTPSPSPSPSPPTITEPIVTSSPVCKDPVFGAFDWKAATLVIQAPTQDGVTIRWTKNEEHVPESSTAYNSSNPLSVDRGARQTLYKARAFKDGFQPSNVVTKSIDTLGTPTIVPTATDTAIEFEIQPTSPSGTLAVSQDGNVPTPKKHPQVAKPVPLSSVSQHSLMVRAYKEDTPETGYFPSGIAQFTADVKQAGNPKITPTTSEELATQSFRVRIEAPTKESSVVFATDAGGEAQLKKPGTVYNDSDRPRLLPDKESGATISAQAVGFSELKIQAAKQVEKAAGRVREYMKGKEINFGGGSWNINDFAGNRPLLEGIANILLENPLASLKLHGLQNGGGGSESAQNLIQARIDFPNVAVPEEGETAFGRIMACKKVLVEEMGIDESRLTTIAEVSTIRAVRFLPDLGALEAHEDGQANKAVTSVLKDGAESIAVSTNTGVYWLPSDVVRVTYNALRCATPTFERTDSGVSMASTTGGASIAYTTSSTETNPSTAYTASAKPKFDDQNASDQLFRAIARREGYMDSKISSHTYAKCPPPTFTVDWDSGDIAVSCDKEPSASIYWSTDNQSPDETSTLSTTTTPTVVYDAAHTTYKARAYMEGKIPSDTTDLVINRCPAPVWATVDQATGQLKLTCEQKGAKIYWNASGTKPNNKDAKQLYDEASNCPNASHNTDSREMQAQAFCTEMTPSIVATSGCGVCKDPVFGAFDWKAATLVIQAPTQDGVTIRWTKNEEHVPESSTAYNSSNPLSVDRGARQTLYKARAFKDGFQPSNVVTKSIDTLGTPTIVPTATDTAIEFEIQPTSPSGTLAVSQDGNVPTPKKHPQVAKPVPLSSVSQHSLMVRAYKEDTPETGYFPSGIAQFTADVKQAGNPKITPTTSEELATQSFRVRIEAPTKESSVVFATDAGGEAQLKKPGTVYNDSDRPRLLPDKESGATISAQAVGFSELKIQAAKQVEKAAGRVREYMKGKEINFGGGSWNINDFAGNRPLLEGIANILLENPLASLKLHGLQNGGGGSESAQNLIQARIDFPNVAVPEEGETAFGRIMACKKVLVEEMGIDESRLTTIAEVSTIRAVRFLPDLGALEAHEDGQANKAVTSVLKDGAESIAVSTNTGVYWLPSDVVRVTYNALRCATPTFERTDSGVSMASTTGGASIAYTTSSTETNPSTAYTASAKPKFDDQNASDQLFRAIARREGYMDSGIGVHTYTAPKVPEPTLKRGGPSKTQVLMECAVTDATINFKIDESTTVQEYNPNEPYMLPTVKVTTITVTAQATRTGSLPSGWVTKSFNIEQVKTPGIVEAFSDAGRDVTMKCDTTDATIEYTLDGGSTAQYSSLVVVPHGASERSVAVVAIARKAGMVASEAAKKTITFEKVQTPVIARDGASVALTVPDGKVKPSSSAYIVYSTRNGGSAFDAAAGVDNKRMQDYNVGSPVVSPVSEESMHIIAQARKQGYIPSDFVADTFTTPKCETPRFSQKVEGYAACSFALKCDTDGSTIYFRDDDGNFMRNETELYTRLVKRDRTKGRSFKIRAMAIASGYRDSDIAEREFEFSEFPPGDAKSKIRHEYEVDDHETSAKDGRSRITSVARKDEELIGDLGMAQPQIWLRRHRADNGLVDETEKKARIKDVLTTISIHLARQGEIPEGYELTEEEITKPSLSMSKADAQKHQEKMSKFLAHVEVHVKPKDGTRRVNRNDESRLLEQWRANQKAEEVEADAIKHEEEIAFVERAFKDPWAALNESGKTQFNNKPIDTVRPMSGLLALEIAIGKHAFRNAKPKQKVDLKAMPARALDQTAFIKWAFKTPWVAVKISGKTEFNGKPIDTRTPMNGLLALEIAIGKDEFKKATRKQKAELKAMPAKALDDVKE